MTANEGALRHVPADECRQLLAGHLPRIGRVAFAIDGRLSVLPVNYALDQEAVVVRVEDGSGLESVATGAPVVFEVDELDPTWQEGWSVLVKGPVAAVTDEGELARLRRLPLRPWAPGAKDRYLRIAPESVTGRRIV